MDAEIARRRGQADGTDAKGTRDSLKSMYGAAKWVFLLLSLSGRSSHADAGVRQGRKVETTEVVSALTHVLQCILLSPRLQQLLIRVLCR